MRIIGLTLMAAAVLAATSACDGEGRSVRDATTAAALSATPAPDGPLLIYESQGDTREVVVFDADGQRELWRFTPAGPYTLSRARETMIELAAGAGGSELRERALADGAAQRLHVLDRNVTSIAVSPDGSTLAFGTTESDRSWLDESIQLLDLASGDVRELIRFEYPRGTHEIIGRPEPLVWRRDGTGIVFRYYPGHGPAGLLATVRTDGRLVDHRLFAYYVSPDGRYAVNDGINAVGCLLQIPQLLRVIDLESGADSAVVEDLGRGIRFMDWAPRGGELLYEQFETYELQPGACVPGLAQSSRTTMLLSAIDGGRESVDDNAVRRAWYGGHDVSVTCRGALEAWGGCEAGEVLTVDGREVERNTKLRVLEFVR